MPGPSRPHPTLALLGFAALTFGSGALSALPVRGQKSWYRQLTKPRFTPPDKAFGPVWLALYGLQTAGAYRIWKAPSSPARTRALAWWTAQLAANTAFSPLFFGKRSKLAGLASSVASAVATMRFIRAAKAVDPIAGHLLRPQAGWVTFASGLMGEIVRRNRGGSAQPHG